MPPFTKTKTERYNYLLKGELIAKPWLDFNTMKEFYRPNLNGITITDGKKPFAKYKTITQAIKEGGRLKKAIANYVAHTK